MASLTVCLKRLAFDGPGIEVRRTTDKQTEHDPGARPVALRLDDIAPLFIAWQQTREAIGSVEVAQPTQISSAMEKLLAARIEMERSVNALLPLVSR